MWLLDDDTRSRLLRDPELTLKKALDICRSNEATRTQVKVLSTASAVSTTTDPTDICTTGKDGRKAQTDKPTYQCGRCGRRHTQPQHCPAIGADCHKCGRKNPFARVCRSGQRAKVHALEEHSSNEEDDEMLIAMLHYDRPQPTEWKTSLKINEKNIQFKIDTGAQCNVISTRVYDQISGKPLQKSQTRLVAFGGHRVKTSGKTVLLCEYKRKYVPVNFEVVQQDVPNILGLKTCMEMNVAKRVDTIKPKKEDLLEEYNDVFNGLGCIRDAKHHIKIKPSHTPVVHPP